MIFAVDGHIGMIRNGLPRIEPCKPILIKTETRRPNRGVYQVEAERKKPHKIGYAVQRKRGVKAEQDIRIVFEKIYSETYFLGFNISVASAWAEGGYTPREYEEIWEKLNPKWKGRKRWAFKYHVIEVRKNVPSMNEISNEVREERVKRTLYPEQTVGYPRL